MASPYLINIGDEPLPPAAAFRSPGAAGASAPDHENWSSIMAFLLSGERPNVAALSANPLARLWRWLGSVTAARAKRTALLSLMELDDHRLEDLGVTRQDLFDAMRHPGAVGHRLSTRRAQSARRWFDAP